MSEPIYYFVYATKTLFIPLKQLYPECYILREGHPSVEPLQCFETSCPANKNCAEVLAMRTNYMFNRHPETEMLMAYFKNSKGSIRAGVFYSDNREDVRVITCNPYGFKRLQKNRDEKGNLKAITYKFIPPAYFYNARMLSNDLIKPEDLILHD